MRHTLPILLCTLLFAVSAAPTQADEKPDATRLRALLTQVRDGLEKPGRTVEEAAAALKDADGAFAFVRDEIAYLPYRGAWHDAQTTLRLRVGNAVDKAVLLEALLRAMQQQAVLVHAAWPADAKPHQSPARKRPTAALAALREALDAAAPSPAGKGDLERLRKEVADAQGVIGNALGAAGQASRLEGVPTQVERTRGPATWAWVRVATGPDAVKDYDPTLPGRARPKGAQIFKPKPTRAVLRVLSGDHELAAWSGAAATLFAQDATILCVPDGRDPGAADEPGKVESWRPRLQIGDERIPGKTFSPRGKQAAPAPSFNPFGGRRRAKPTAAKTLRLELRFESPGDEAGYAATFGRDLMRFEKGFDPQQLVALYRVGAGVGLVPYEVTVARQIDELLDLHDMHAGVDLKKPGAARALRGPSARTARVINALSFLQGALPADPIDLGWTGPTVFVESVSLAQGTDALQAIARIDIWHRAFGPAEGSTRRQRLAWGLSTLAMEGHLLRAESVNTRLGADAEKLGVVAAAKQKARVAGDEIAAGVLAAGGVVLVSPAAPDLTWSLPKSGDLLGTIRTRGATAKGGESRSQAAGRGYAALGSAAMSALGAPSGMLVGAIAAYLNELASVYTDVTKVLDALGKTMETGDDKHILEAIGKYRGDIAQRLTRALGEGAARGWAESAIGAGLGHALPAAGSALGGRIRDGAIAGGLAYPKDLPVVSDAIRASANVLTK